MIKGNAFSGECVDACKTGTGAGGCNTCGLEVAGVKYCSKCATDTEAPLNGACATSTTRVNFCTTVANGACTKCAAGYFLQNGGCYENSRAPGDLLCSVVGADGTCTTCYAGAKTGTAGGCNTCPSGCLNCMTPTGESKAVCTSCLSGAQPNGSGSCGSGGLSAGAIAGIVIAVLVVVGGLTGFLVWWFVCRK